MAVGRKPKSAAVRAATGNPGGRPLDEPKPQPIAPQCPEWLDDVAKEKWQELAPKLDKLGLLTEADGEAFALLCAHWSNAVRAQQALNREGLVVDGKRNPAAAQLKENSEAFRRYCALFGMNPTDRARLRTPEAADEEDEFFNQPDKGKFVFV